MAFAISFACLTGALLLPSLAIAIAWRFLPPTFVRHCFGADHFTTCELDDIARSNRLVRMAALMRVAAFPASGKRRGLETAWRLAPPWFIWFSRIVLPLYLVPFAVPLLLITRPSCWTDGGTDCVASCADYAALAMLANSSNAACALAAYINDGPPPM